MLRPRATAMTVRARAQRAKSRGPLTPPPARPPRRHEPRRPSAPARDRRRIKGAEHQTPATGVARSPTLRGATPVSARPQSVPTAGDETAAAHQVTARYGTPDPTTPHAHQTSGGPASGVVAGIPRADGQWAVAGVAGRPGGAPGRWSGAGGARRRYGRASARPCDHCMRLGPGMRLVTASTEGATPASSFGEAEVAADRCGELVNATQFGGHGGAAVGGGAVAKLAGAIVAPAAHRGVGE